MKDKKIIYKREETNSSGYSKIFQSGFLRNIKNKEALFQGIFDGDGCIKIHTGILLSLSIDHTINYNPLVKELKLIPTSIYKNEIRLAPASLKNLGNNISAKVIANQIKFLIKSAENSIRPDKVYGIINLFEYVSDKTYGTYNHCLPIQTNIRNELLKLKLENDIKQLKKRYPKKNDRYQPFIPKWSEKFSSKRVWKQEFWDFFINQEYLVRGQYDKNIDFSSGIPVNFRL